MSSTEKTNAEANSVSITFNWVGQAKTAEIVGAFGLPEHPDWEPMAMSWSDDLKAYQISLSLEQEKLYHYKFVVDGERVCDPKADTSCDSEGTTNNVVYIPLKVSTPESREGSNKDASCTEAKEGGSCATDASTKASANTDGESSCQTPAASASTHKDCPAGAERHVSFDPATLTEQYDPVDLSDPEANSKKYNYISENVYYSKSETKVLEPICETEKDSDHTTLSKEKHPKSLRHNEDIKIPYKSRRRGLPNFNAVNQINSEACKETETHASESHVAEHTEEAAEEEGCGQMRSLAQPQDCKRFEQENQETNFLEPSPEPTSSCPAHEASVESDTKNDTPNNEASLDPSPDAEADQAIQACCEGEAMEESSPASNEVLPSESYQSKAQTPSEAPEHNAHGVCMGSTHGQRELSAEDASLVDESAEMPEAHSTSPPASSDPSYAATPRSNDNHQVDGESQEDQVHTGYYCPTSRKFLYGVAPPEEAPEEVASPAHEPKGQTQDSDTSEEVNDGKSSYYDPVQGRFVIVSQEAPAEATGDHDVGSSVHVPHVAYFDPASGKFVVGPRPADEAQAAGKPAPSVGSHYDVGMGYAPHSVKPTPEVSYATGHFDAASGKFSGPRREASHSPSDPGVQTTASYGKAAAYFDPTTGTFVTGYRREPVQPAAPHAGASYEKPSSYFDPSTGTFVSGHQRPSAQPAGKTYGSSGYGAQANAGPAYGKPSSYPQSEPVLYAAPQEVYVGSKYGAQTDNGAPRDQPSAYFDPSLGVFVSGYQRPPAQYAAPQEARIENPYRGNIYEGQTNVGPAYGKPSYTGGAAASYQREPAQYPGPREGYAASKYDAQADVRETYGKPASYFDPSTGTFVTSYQRPPAPYTAPQETYGGKSYTAGEYVSPSKAGPAYGKPSYPEVNAGNYSQGYQREPQATAPQEIYLMEPYAGKYEAQVNVGAAYEKPSYPVANTGAYTHGYQREPAQYGAPKYEAQINDGQAYGKPPSILQGYQREPAQYAAPKYEAQGNDGQAYGKPPSIPQGYQREPGQYSAPQGAYVERPYGAPKYEYHANNGAAYEKPASYPQGYQREPAQYTAPQEADAERPHVAPKYEAQANTRPAHEKPSSYFDPSTGTFVTGYQREHVAYAAKAPQEFYLMEPHTRKYATMKKAGSSGYYDFTLGKFVSGPQEKSHEQTNNEDSYSATPNRQPDYNYVEDSLGATEEHSYSTPAQEAVDATYRSGRKQGYPKANPNKDGAHEEAVASKKQVGSKPIQDPAKPKAGEELPPRTNEPAEKKPNANGSSESVNESVIGSVIGTRIPSFWKPIFHKVTPNKLRFLNDQQSAPESDAPCLRCNGGQYRQEPMLAFDADADDSYAKDSSNTCSKPTEGRYHTAQVDRNGNLYHSEYLGAVSDEDPQEEDLLKQLGQDSSSHTPQEEDCLGLTKDNLLSGMPHFSKSSLIAFAAVYMLASFKGSTGSFSIIMVLPLLCLLALSVAAMNISAFIKHNNIGWKCNDNFSISIFQDNGCSTTQAITLNSNHVIAIFFLALALVGIISMVSISGFYVVGAFAKRTCY